MKTTSVLTLALLFSTGSLVYGQDTEKKDTTEQQVTIIIKTVPKKNGETDTVYVKNNNDGKKKSDHKHHLGNDWYFDLGLNNYLENGKFPNENGKAYRLKTGLDYFAIGTMYQQQLGDRKSPAFIKSGLELSFNGFMFVEDRIAKSGADGVILTDIQTTSPTIRKSKLGVSYLSIPIMFMLDYKRVDRGNLKLGIGGYIGYRLKSWSKVKFDDGSRKKEADDFYMSNIRYGLEGQIGLGWLNLFAKYDFNSLFSSGKAFDRTQELNALNIGIRI